MHIENWNITSEEGGFHFGRHGLGQEETAIAMASDSLFAALVNRLAIGSGVQAVETFITPFLQGSPPFALSSTFPFAGDIRFFPVPLAAMYATSTESEAKDYKRVQFVSEGLFRELLNGKTMPAVFASAQKLMGGRLLVGTDEIDGLPPAIRKDESPVWGEEVRPRVTLGRSAQNSSIYFTGRVTYAKDCGLWFGIYWDREDDPLKTQLHNLFTDLGDAGLGAERSAGFGACRFVQKNVLDLPDAGHQPWVSLSRYLPSEDETGALTWEKAAYRIVSVGGWLDSPSLHGQRRRPVNLIEEGATLGNVPHPIPGALVDVRPKYAGTADLPGHPVYRSGLSLAVGWKGGLG
jgi:CRISPR-associated protein Csm4